ncbi:MFS transporter [Dictyobacter alpinus]|uniref:MFS transporter n=1 Tax=Dictyobacter alpinus TaxID=2014873 RepID=A0A402BJ42_9CHLR|nr:MFS transporter [Dictyobacter alpinus]GCE31383.1 MFS transporter [Dictyobacter alpinus]
MRTRFPALQSRDFRLLWGGQLFSGIGTQMQIIAINWHAYQLLRGQAFHFSLFQWHFALDTQALGLGLLGLIRVVPIFLFALFGGMLADRYDRRLLVLWAQIISAICSGLLALLTFTGQITVVLLYILTALGVAITAFDEPAQNALYPELVADEDLPNAATLYSLLWNIGTIVGPLLATLLLVVTNLGSIYLCNALSFLVALVTVFAMRYRGKSQPAQMEQSWRMMGEGLRFASQTRMIWSSMLLDCGATFFASARMMLPLVADRVLHAGVVGYGLLGTAQPLGSILTGFTLVIRKPIQHQGRVLLISVALYGLATALFGLSPFFWLSYVLFALTGVGDTISTVVRSMIRLEWTPEAMRGRINAIHMMVAFGGPQVGELEAGLLTALSSVSFTLISGGLVALLLVGWTAWRYPDLRTYKYEPRYKG